MSELTSEVFQQSIGDLLKLSPNHSPENPLVLCVGLSGGVDSVVLLHLLSCLQSTSTFSYSLKAIHINHQLDSSSNDWQSFCIAYCEKLNIPLKCVSVDAKTTHGEGPEAAARNARYDAFKKNLNDKDVLLTAHHLDDQIETVFLQMLRGTGVDGAAGINSITEFNLSYLLRPLLTYPRAEIEKYAIKSRLEWVEDPSNIETNYDRNYLRHKLLPIIENRWPSYRETIGRFSQHMRTTSDLLNKISANDFQLVNNKVADCISIQALNDLSQTRKNNVIRYWMNIRINTFPTTAQLNQIENIITARDDADPILRFGQFELRRFQNALYLIDKNQNPDLAYFSKDVGFWNLGKSVSIPGFGSLTLKTKKGEGIKPDYLLSNNITIRLRRGGERCHPVDRSKSQLLKKIFQEKQIPPWRRNAIPLVYIDGKIAAAFGEFYCKPFAIEDGDEEGLIFMHTKE